MRRHLPLLFVLYMLVITSCSNKKETLSVALPPAKAVLVFPAQNSACTVGTTISTTQSAITFSWNSADNADSYDVTIKNLLTGAQSTQSATTNQLAVTLLRDTPYSWFVVSKSSAVSTTAQSDTWKFYNAGLGTVSHPPFPADLLVPGYGQNITATAGVVNLGWVGADPDNDVAGYDIYLGSTNTPGILKSGVTDMFLNGVSVTAGTTYYWRVITKDVQGNSSDSGLYQFKAN